MYKYLPPVADKRTRGPLHSLNPGHIPFNALSYSDTLVEKFSNQKTKSQTIEKFFLIGVKHYCISASIVRFNS